MRLVKPHTPSNFQRESSPAGFVAVTEADFIALPRKSLTFRGVSISRATLIRAIKAGRLKSRLFRQPGSTAGRRYLLRDALDSFINEQMADEPLSRATPLS